MARVLRDVREFLPAVRASVLRPLGGVLLARVAVVPPILLDVTELPAARGARVLHGDDFHRGRRGRRGFGLRRDHFNRGRRSRRPSALPLEGRVLLAVVAVMAVVLRGVGELPPAPRGRLPPPPPGRGGVRLFPRGGGRPFVFGVVFMLFFSFFFLPPP